MLRYFVERQWIKYKGKMYLTGDLLPENFTEKEKFRTLYPSRIGVKEVPEVAKTISGTTPVKPLTSTGVKSESETKVASPSKPTGTPAATPTTQTKA